MAVVSIPGIGEKQAVALLQKYQTLENIYEHLNELPAGQRAKLEAGREDSIQSKMLATILLNVPIEIDLEKCRTQKADYEKIKNLFETLEFKGLLKKLLEFGALINLPTKIEQNFPAAKPSSAAPVSKAKSSVSSAQQSLF